VAGDERLCHIRISHIAAAEVRVLSSSPRKMPAPSQLLSSSFSVAAIFVWGTSDFVGGYAAKRANAFLLTMLAHASGLVFMLVLALSTRSALPNPASVWWAIAAGLSGGAALAIFYRALAQGKMGLTAPVAAVLGAAIPTFFGIWTDGLPHAWQLAGFVVAACGIWLISRQEDTDQRPEGIGMAMLAGLGFAGFFLFIKQTGDGAAFWSAAISRAASFVLVGGIVLCSRTPWRLNAGAAALGVVAGSLDTLGTALFIRASQTGRLDVAVVLSSLYPAVTVALAWLLLKERLTRWRAVGMLAALAAVPLIAT
jgi:drug/metabolite transporter (DMT)-like permease